VFEVVVYPPFPLCVESIFGRWGWQVIGFAGFDEKLACSGHVVNFIR
jgi:hypothetical protein